MIELKHLGKTYETSSGSVTALRDIDLTIQDGEIFGVIGLSGAGKSTLVRCINLLERPTQGEVWIDGQELTRLPQKQLLAMRRNIGMIFQGFNLLEQRTVLSNVAFPLMLAGEKKEMLYQVCLDAKGKLLTCRCISKGSVAASPVSVRQVVENALYAGASSIILAHNHPSGVALPSQQDLLVTRQIQEALSPLNIRLADHVVVADSDYVSMAESGLLAR